VYAKMPPNQKPPEPGEYECIWCETVFEVAPERDSLACPNCGNKDRKDLVPIYIANMPDDEAMYTPDSYPAGD
jgi:PHP family Zn ribbon phosphoesterase